MSISPSQSLLSVEDARAGILAQVQTLSSENCPNHEALGRTLAEEVRARRTLPPWDNSAMDGYAVQSTDVAQAPVRLRCVEAIFAGGRSQRSLQSGECARIMTGAPLPEGADAVVMQERTRLVTAEEVEILESVPPRHFVRDRGEDSREGEPLFPFGTALGIPELGLLWAQGIGQIKVPRRPTVGILSTGDELCLPADAGGDWIVDTNGPALALAVRRAGGVPTMLGIARDRLDDVLDKLSDARAFDFVITSAGVSVGEKDFVREALQHLGVEMSFWRVAVKPGKPLAFGRKGSTLFFGLPGNPASSLVSFELFVRPALRRSLGHLNVEPMTVPGKTRTALAKPPGVAHYLRCTVEREGSDVWARPLGSQTSGALRSAVGATHLLVFPADATSISAGDEVQLLPVSWTA